MSGRVPSCGLRCIRTILAHHSAPCPTRSGASWSTHSASTQQYFRGPPGPLPLTAVYSAPGMTPLKYRLSRQNGSTAIPELLGWRAVTWSSANTSPEPAAWRSCSDQAQCRHRTWASSDCCLGSLAVARSPAPHCVLVRLSVQT